MTSLGNIISRNTKITIESFAKAITTFSVVYLAMRWARRSDIEYDSTLVAGGAIVAVILGI
tara:strand:+ start:2172 stop:2354 length:183 start_codon:yes stop_codon:yes gene_type:complete